MWPNLNPAQSLPAGLPTNFLSATNSIIKRPSLAAKNGMDQNIEFPLR